VNSVSEKDTSCCNLNHTIYVLRYEQTSSPIFRFLTANASILFKVHVEYVVLLRPKQMCIIGLTLGEPGWGGKAPFFLGHSRDEMLSRCAGPLEVLQDGMNGFIICPRDLKCGGTWFAYGSHNGIICALVNVRAVFIPSWPHVEASRGELVLQMVGKLITNVYHSLDNL